MKRINKYLVEKLKINKDIENVNHSSDYDTMIKKIAKICGFYIDSNDDVQFIAAISNWVEENEISSWDDLYCYADYNDLDTSKLILLKDYKLIKYIDDAPNKVKFIFKKIKKYKDNDNIVKAFDSGKDVRGESWEKFIYYLEDNIMVYLSKLPYNDEIICFKRK